MKFKTVLPVQKDVRTCDVTRIFDTETGIVYEKSGNPTEVSIYSIHHIDKLVYTHEQAESFWKEIDK